MAGQTIIQSRSAATLLLGIWFLCVFYVAAATFYFPEHELRHPAILSSAAIVALLMELGWVLMILNTAAATARLAWTLGLLMLVIHILLAFWLAHGWSHAAAVEHVRRVGGYGIGIIVNYLFAVIWSVDIAWWWINPESRANRPRSIGWLIHGFLFFVLLNATVIFGNPDQRLLYSMPIVALVFLFIRRQFKSSAM